jgi:tRNA (guanosine-2'-O-)-methyltransferase
MGKMRRVTGEGGDVFKPKGQLRREIELAERVPDQVIRILAKRLSAARRARIERVVAHRRRGLTIAIEGLIDPHNTAAVIRTAEAFGLQTVHIIEQGDRFLSSRKVTQGTHKWVDLAVWKGAEAFHKVVKGEGKRLLVADAGARMTLAELDRTRPTALVFGNEHLGVTDEMRALSDGSFAIPMCGFAESVNVSVAAGIAISTLCNPLAGDLSPKERAVLLARFYLRAVRAGYDIVMREMSSDKRPLDG